MRSVDRNKLYTYRADGRSTPQLRIMYLFFRWTGPWWWPVHAPTDAAYYTVQQSRTRRYGARPVATWWRPWQAVRLARYYGTHRSLFTGRLCDEVGVAARRVDCDRMGTNFDSNDNKCTKAASPTLSPLADANGFVQTWPHLTHCSFNPCESAPKMASRSAQTFT